MVTAVKALIDAGIAAQSVALLGENVRVATQSFNKNKSGSGTKKLVGLGVTNIVGISLLRSQSQLAQGL